MIYFCADDYGLCGSASERIRHCLEYGALNKVSFFANFDDFDIGEFAVKADSVSLHLNLVEGKAMSEPSDIPLIADSDGVFRHSFTGLLKLSILNKKRFEEQIYREIKEQVLFWKEKISDRFPFNIDSHQHTHMIPSVFKMLMKVIKEEKINVEFIRIPKEPLMPFIFSPSLYFTYRPVNLIKQWLLKFLWLFNIGEYKKNKIPSALFFGILFSGYMDKKRVKCVLSKYVKLAERKNMDIEVLFHPGYIDKNDIDAKDSIVAFEDFYYSDGRKTEFEAVLSLDINSFKKEECINAVH